MFSDTLFCPTSKIFTIEELDPVNFGIFFLNFDLNHDPIVAD